MCTFNSDINFFVFSTNCKLNLFQLVLLSKKQPKISMPTVDDGISWNRPAPNFKVDAEKFLSKFEDDSAMDDGSTGFSVQPDSRLSGSAETW